MTKVERYRETLRGLGGWERSSDPDVEWVVRENLKKARLAGLR